MSDNPPAFPCEAQPDRNVPPENDWIQTGIYSGKFPGMSLRDWFAGQALSGLLANSELGIEGQEVAQIAFQYADAMLAERKKGGAS